MGPIELWLATKYICMYCDFSLLLSKLKNLPFFKKKNQTWLPCFHYGIWFKLMRLCKRNLQKNGNTTSALAMRSAALRNRKREVCTVYMEILIQSWMPLTWEEKHIWVMWALSEPTWWFHKTFCAFAKRFKPPQAYKVECKLQEAVLNSIVFKHFLIQCPF